MKLHIASDFHTEFTPHWSYTPPSGVDVNIAAGDIGSGIAGLWHLKSLKNDAPWLMVAGNHEHYGRSMPENIADMHAASKEIGASVQFLEGAVVPITVHGENVVFFGTTLWTDFCIDNDWHKSARFAKEYMNDYRQIYADIGTKCRLTPEDTMLLHDLSVSWLDREMAKYPNDKKVVITHHAPSLKSISPQFVGHDLNGAFVSDLEWLMHEHRPVLWVHGHVHSSHDYTVGSTRVVCNPRGYATDPWGIGVRFENKQWNPNLVVEI